jgi:hypothetical protein
MRLQVLVDGFSPFQKIPIGLVRALGKDIPGPVAVMSYRRSLWGKYASACFQEAMRGSTRWERGECEIFAAFVSKLNDCAY